MAFKRSKPRAASTTDRPTSSAVLTATDSDNPFESASVDGTSELLFGDPFGSLATRTTIADQNKAATSKLWIGASLAGLVVLVAGIAFGVRWFRPQSNSTNQDRQRSAAVFQNAGRNYEIVVDPNRWKHDAERTKQLSIDLAFRNVDMPAWLLIASDENTSEIPSRGELADGAQKWLESGIANKTRVERSDGRLADLPAILVGVSGTDGEKQVRRQAVVAFSQGITYRVAFWSDADKFESGHAEFQDACSKFRLLADRPRWKEALRNPSNLVEFRSEKFPYLLKAPRDLWKAAPDLPVTTRYADLKMVDRSKDANVVVSPRETKNLDAFREAYVGRIQKEYEGAKVTIRLLERDLKIRGRPAQRVKLLVTDPTGEFILLTTFLEVDTFIYPIECRAPLGKAASFEPAFNAIVESFEIVALPKSATLPGSIAISETKSEPPKTPASQPPKTTAKADDEKPKTESKPETKTPAKAKSPETKPATKADEKAKASKRKSLDDLD